MNADLKSLASNLDKVGNSAQFVELQIHDKLQWKFDDVARNAKLVLPAHFEGYLTLHGEGETDGRRKIRFASMNEQERKDYVFSSIELYGSVARYFSSRVRRIILHPDTIQPSVPRENQIQQLAASLVDMQDQFQEVEVCIEPRGGDRQGKVLRLYLDDILSLEKNLLSIQTGKSPRIGLCIDIAQLVIVHGNSGSAQLLDALKTSNLEIKEFHASDIAMEQNRVAVEIGKGRVDWTNMLVSLVQSNCKSLLVETLGGVKVFQRSKTYLDSLVVNSNEVLL